MRSISIKIGNVTTWFSHTLPYSFALHHSTNLLALYAFTSSPFTIGNHKNLSMISQHVFLSLHNIDAFEH